jgi:hypothetical protein
MLQGIFAKQIAGISCTMPGQVNFLQVNGRHARKSIQQQSKASSSR